MVWGGGCGRWVLGVGCGYREVGVSVGRWVWGGGCGGCGVWE